MAGKILLRIFMGSLFLSSDVLSNISGRWILFSSQSCTHNSKCEKINLGAHCLGRFGRFRYFEHACSYNIEIDVNFPFYDLINFTNFAAKHFEM
jgi:hypothetical protein